MSRIRLIVPLGLFALIATLIFGWQPFGTLEIDETALPYAQESHTNPNRATLPPRRIYFRDPQNHNSYTLARFETPIRLRVIEPSPLIAPFVTQKLIPALDGLDIALAGEGEPYNLALIRSASVASAFAALADDFIDHLTILQDGTARDLVGNPDLHCRLERNARGAELTAALILMPDDPLSDPLAGCLAETLPKALGITGGLAAELYLGGHFLAPPLKDSDILSLRQIYRPELRAGMTRTQVEAILTNLAVRKPD